MARTPVQSRTDEEKRKYFEEDIEKKMDLVIKNMNKVKKMASPKTYSFTEKDKNQILAAVDQKRQEIEEAFDAALNKPSGSKKENETFNIKEGLKKE